MSYLILPSRFTRQPQGAVEVDWSHPIARGMQCGFVAAPMRDAVPLLRFTTNTTVPQFAGGVLCQVFSGSLGYVSHQTPLNDASPWSVVAFGVQPTVAASAVATLAENAGSSIFDRSLGIQSDGTFRSYIYDGSSKTNTTTASITAGAQVSLAATCGGGSLNAYINGSGPAATAVSNNGYTAYTGTNYFNCGYGGPGSGTLTSNFRAAYVLRWTRKLSDAEILELAKSPWQLFRKPQPRIWVPAAGGGVTQALTGSASTGSAGTLAPSLSVALTGQAATAAAGTLAPAHTQAITGTAATASAGTLVGSKSAALAGQAATAAAGTAAPSHEQALSGTAVTAAAGTITYTAGIAVALTGQAATASAGTVAPEHAQAITGQAATAAAGTISYSGSAVVNVALTGQAATASAGTLTPSHSQTLTGEASSSAAGTISYTSATVLNLALTGQAATVSAGSLVRAASLTLAGQGITGEAGALAPSLTKALTGQASSALAGTLVYVPGISIALTGQAVTATAGTLSPGIALLLAGSDIVVSAGTMTISGTEPVLRYAAASHTFVADARVRSVVSARARTHTASARVRVYVGDN